MLQFTKMQAAGNDFVVVDATENPERFSAGRIRALADRHYGIGFDQLLVVKKTDSPGADFGYKIFNADGSEAGMCGNGARCFALFVFNHGLTKKKNIVVKANQRLITLELLEDNMVRVKMGKARFSPDSIPFIADSFEKRVCGKAKLYKVKKKGEEHWFGVANMGNPHAVFVTQATFANQVVMDAPLEELARVLKLKDVFPKDVNVSVLQVRSKDEAFLRVYERGVGETLACGSGACAAFSIAHRMGLLEEKATIRMPGGQVTVEVDLNRDVFLTGSATEVFTGCTPL